MKDIISDVEPNQTYLAADHVATSKWLLFTRLLTPTSPHHGLLRFENSDVALLDETELVACSAEREHQLHNGLGSLRLRDQFYSSEIEGYFRIGPRQRLKSITVSMLTNGRAPTSTGLPRDTLRLFLRRLPSTFVQESKEVRMFDIERATSRPPARITATRHLHINRMIAIVAIGILGMIVSTSTAHAAGAVYDDFGNGAIDSHLWTTQLSGGSSIVENAGGIVATIPANATSPGSTFGAQLISRCELRGDFDIRVDFRLPVWPPTNGVRAALGITGTNAGGLPGVAIIERASLANGELGGSYSEVYAFDTGAAVAIDGFDLEGRLRLTRVGDTVTGYALTGGTWVQVGSNALGPISDARFVLNTFTSDAVFGDVNVQVIYDNVVIEVGQLVNCPSPPTTHICDFEGFLQPVDNPEALNTGRSGRTYPIKWRCIGEDGAYVSDLGIVKSIGSQRVLCSNVAYDSLHPLEVSTSGNSALRYDEQNNQFIFNWQTPRSGATECYVFVLVLSDNSVYTANFQLRP